MQITVDLRTRMLPPEHNVFMARPGQESRLYDDFIQGSMIGPELPGVNIVAGKAISDQSNLEDKLKKSAAIRSWATKGKSDEDYPLDRLSDYSDKARTRGASQFISILNGFFQKAQKGDLVVIPPNAYSRNTVLGEFRDDPSDIRYLKVERYGNFALPVRRFRRLAEIPKRELPSALLDVIGKPLAFVEVRKSIRPFLYGVAYDSYVLGSDYNAKFEVTSPNYNTNDDFFLLAFLNFITANTRNVTIEGGKPILGLHTAAFEELGEFAAELRTNVNSPGFLSVSSNFITPLVMAAMLALALQVGPDAAEAEKIIIGNSNAPADDPCTAEVEKSVWTQMKLYGLDNWPEACEMARRAAKDTGLKASPRIKIDD